MKDEYNFNPEAWQAPDEKPEATKATPQPAQQSSNGDVASDVDIVLQRAEVNGTDIAPDYEQWRDAGFGLASQFGEAGREYFLRMSKLHPGCTDAAANDQFNKCLNGHGSGITIRSFFDLARKAGIDIRTRDFKSPKSPKLPKSPQKPNGNNGEIGDSGETEQLQLPTFSDLVQDQLPDFLKDIAAVGESPQETDALILTAITVLGSCLPGVQGQYDGVTVFPSLFYFLSARASSGKGKMALCRYLVRPIHRRLKELHELAMEHYEEELAKWEGENKKTRGPKPKKPAQTMLIIPANTSATAVYQLLADNDGKGLIFETEGDTLANAFESDFGNFSDGFRKAFHHEPISYHRRAGDEDVEIEQPQLSTVLSGTPRQIVSLIKDAENGLFSRFIFYRLHSKLEWKDVLAQRGEKSLDKQFTELGDEFVGFYDILFKSGDINFKVTEEQRKKFNEFFSSLQTEFFNIFKDDILASVRRLGLICYRVAMILSSLRIMETGDFSQEMVCDDVDFETALTISRVLSVHTAHIFDELQSAGFARTATVAKSAKKARFLDALPPEFDRQDYLETAEQENVPPSTADKWIKAFCAPDGPLEKTEHGQYKKK